MPFGRPRNVDAMRTDPRFAELRQHIWHQLHTAKPAQRERRGRSRDHGRANPRAARRRARAVRRQGARRTRRRRAPDAADAPQSRASALVSVATFLSLWEVVGAQHRSDPVHHAEQGRHGRGRHDRQRRAVDLSLAEPGGAALSASRLRSSSGSASGSCWRASGCSTWRSASTSPSSIRSRRSRWCR